MKEAKADVEASDITDNAKTNVQDKEGIPPGQQRLIYTDKHSKDGSDFALQHPEGDYAPLGAPPSR